MVVYHNQPKFRPDAYFADSISKESVLTKIKVYDNDVSWRTNFFINKHMLADEVDLI